MRAHRRASEQTSEQTNKRCSGDKSASIGRCGRCCEHLEVASFCHVHDYGDALATQQERCEQEKEGAARLHCVCVGERQYSSVWRFVSAPTTTRMRRRAQLQFINLKRARALLRAVEIVAQTLARSLSGSVSIALSAQTHCQLSIDDVARAREMQKIAFARAPMTRAARRPPTPT